MYDNAIISNTTNTTTSTYPCTDHDDISILLHQFLSRASSSSSLPMPSPPSLMSQRIHSLTPLSHFSPENQHLPPPAMGPTRFSGADSYTAGYFQPVESFDNDPDDYDCDNEVKEFLKLSKNILLVRSLIIFCYNDVYYTCTHIK